MSDIKSREARSENMSRIRAKDTEPEKYIRKLLFSSGYRYRKNDRSVCGCPDIYLKKYNTAIFVHGCYWHRHQGCKYSYSPKSRVEFWNKKFEDNVQRDLIVRDTLRKEKIRCIVIWECTIKRMKQSAEERDYIMQRIEAALNGVDYYLVL